MNRRCQNDLDPKESMKTRAMNTASIEHREGPSPTHDLTSKRVVVVGGKTGIGLGVARAAQAAGATVVVASRRHISAEERPDLALFEQVNLDLRDEASVRAAFEAIGPFDHLHVTAGTRSAGRSLAAVAAMRHRSLGARIRADLPEVLRASGQEKCSHFCTGLLARKLPHRPCCLRPSRLAMSQRRATPR
jgi:threonine dehydrogenase-like Zn-dependent dehydrogenase